MRTRLAAFIAALAVALGLAGAIAAPAQAATAPTGQIATANCSVTLAVTNTYNLYDVTGSQPSGVKSYTYEVNWGSWPSTTSVYRGKPDPYQGPRHANVHHVKVTIYPAGKPPVKCRGEWNEEEFRA